MRRIAAIITGLALAVAFVVAPRIATEAEGEAFPPHSKAFGKTLTEWMQLYVTSLLSGGEDHAGRVKFLPLPPIGDPVGVTEDGLLIFRGHRDVTLRRGTPFVLPVAIWIGERYLSHPPDEPLQPDVFTDPRNLITVYIDGTPVMDSTVASVSPFYFGPAPLSVIYQPPPPPPPGAIAAIFVQGIGFVHPPLSVGTHEIVLVSELRIPASVNPEVYPDGVGVRFENTWTITVSPQ
jgi:hypothetical protein